MPIWRDFSKACDYFEMWKSQIFEDDGFFHRKLANIVRVEKTQSLVEPTHRMKMVLILVSYSAELETLQSCVPKL